MPKINIIRPPKVSVDARKNFWKQIGMIIIGTTISLLLTITAAQLLERHQRAKDRKLSAMMVLSNIEKFARALDDHASALDNADSVATWLLSKPVEELEMLPEEELDALINQVTTFFFMSYDKSAENIFSNNIETWKNMGNVHFIDQVGQCFSAMHSIEEYWDKWTTGINETCADISNHPDQYEGSSNNSKILCNDKMRHYIGSIHTMRGWLSYTAATMRYHNRRNMASIGITEKAVLDYTNARDMEEGNQEVEPNPSDFYTAPLDPANLTSMQRYDARIEELKR